MSERFFDLTICVDCFDPEGGAILHNICATDGRLPQIGTTALAYDGKQEYIGTIRKIKEITRHEYSRRERELLYSFSPQPQYR